MKKEIKKRCFIGTGMFCLLCICLLLRQYILANLVTPLALLFWIFLRYTLLSLDQKTLWFIMIYGVAFFYIIKFQPSGTFISSTRRDFLNSYERKVHHWRDLFTYRSPYCDVRFNPRKNLIELLKEHYAAENLIESNYQITSAFRNKEIPVPQTIYTFLFPPIMKKRPYIVRLLLEMADRTRGTEKKAFYENLEEYILYLENTMEYNNDNQ